MLYTTCRFNDSKDLNLNKKKGNALREYKKTITLSQMQREAGFARALPLICQRSVRRRLYTFIQRQSRWKPVLRVQFVQTIARANYLQLPSGLFMTLLVHLHKYGIFVIFVALVPPRFINLWGFKLLVIIVGAYNRDSLFHLDYKDNGCRRRGRVGCGAAEFLKIVTNYWRKEG